MSNEANAEASLPKIWEKMDAYEKIETLRKENEGLFQHLSELGEEVEKFKKHMHCGGKLVYPIETSL